MGIIGRNTLLKLLENLEREAQSALAYDPSYLEALQNLKWEVDGDPRVKAAIRELRTRGLIVFGSFDPRIRISLRQWEVLCGPERFQLSDPPLSEEIGYEREHIEEPATLELRDAANAVLGSSLFCQELDKIVNEALQASPSFERLATGLERSGYELHLCLDLSMYARVLHPAQMAEPIPLQKPQIQERLPSNDQSSGRDPRPPFSSQDVEFLRRLRITP